MLSKVQLFNAKNAGLKIEKDLTIKIVNVGSFPDTDKDGHPVEVTALESETGEMYTTISGTIASSVDLLDEIITENGSATVKVLQNTSNGGREFFQLQIIG